MRQRLIWPILVFTILGSVVPASGHDTYLLPQKFVAPSPVAIDLTSAETFPALEYGPKKARISKTLVQGPDRLATLKVLGESKLALRFSLSAKEAGTYVAAILMPPRDIDLGTDKVTEYFAEIDAPPALRAAYDALPEPRLWRETYTKYSKTAVCVETCSGADILTTALGLKLEFVAVKDGDVGKFRLLAAGTPLPRAAVAISNGGKRTIQRTDTRGDITLPEKLSGPVMLAAVIVAAPASAGARFTSDFATLTFDADAIATP